MPQTFTITPDSQGQRLDKFLAETLPGRTRSQIQKMIKSGLVQVSGRPAKVHHFLKTGDNISIEIRDQRLEIKKIVQSLPPAAYRLPPKIIFEDDNYLVLEKPVGLLVHATEQGETNTLVDWLIKKYPTIESVGEQKYRAGIIHRLDKDVSGVMVVAKNNKAFSDLKEQFKKRQVKKEYLALVYGRIQNEEGEIDLPIGRGRDGQFVAHPKTGQEKFQEDDRWAKTKYQVLERIKDYTFLKVEILTGRTHQIRAHLAAVGHPILGDQIYKPKKKFFHLFSKKIKVIELPRIFLHSTKIGFYDLNHYWREFESPLPDEIKNFLDVKKTS